MKLAPIWLSADGRRVEDKNSPLYKSKLPDLTNRFPLGAKVREDVTTNDEKTQGSSTRVVLEGTASRTKYLEKQEKQVNYLEMPKLEGYF